MESNIVGNKKQREGKNYPYLGICVDGTETIVVLFTSYRQGICIFSTDVYYKIGETRDWAENEFNYFDNTVELRN